MKAFATKALETLKHHADKAVQRSLDKHLKIAVTGLSRAGKTAFITSFVHQLTQQADQRNLPFFQVIQEGRFIGCRKSQQGNLHIPAFDYAGATDAILNDFQWPESTRAMSELRLTLKYRSEHPVVGQLKETHTLTLDIIDYPGEWLMDLPLLSMNYQSWSSLMISRLNQGPRQQKSQPFLDALSQFDLSKPADEKQLKSLAQMYTELLKQFKAEGYSLIQPGRFILPGELEGAPLLAFFPLLPEHFVEFEDVESLPHDGGYLTLVRRYDAYCEQVVKPFYQQYFRHFDRQVVLVDCLSALNGGYERFLELRQAMHQVLQSFTYGRRSLLHRLFAPQIDRILFAATKADHVTPEQHMPLVQLLDEVINDAQQDMTFEGASVETMALASINTTEVGTVTQDGTVFPCVRGYVDMSSAIQSRADDEPQVEYVTMFPGEVPHQLPDKHFWRKQAFEFKAFLPNRQATSIAHLRLDHALQFLLGDKLR